MATKITCVDGTKRQVPFALSGILVLPVPQPTITISGTENISREYEPFKRGVRIFADLRISVSRGEGEIEPIDGVETKLDRCSISVFPPLNPDHEEIHLPESMLKALNIGGSISNNGWEIIGADMVYNYEQIVRQVTYSNQKPAYYLNRQFKIVCSELNQRFVSNEFVETLTVIHPAVASDGGLPPHPSHHQVSRYAAELPSAHLLTQSRPYFSTANPEQGNAVVVVVIVCMGLLVTVLSVGVVRLRAAHNREHVDHGEVECNWEGAPNITVNPLEESESGGAVCHPMESDIDEGSSDDEMYEEESEDDDDEENTQSKDRLGWEKDI